MRKSKWPQASARVRQNGWMPASAIHPGACVSLHNHDGAWLLLLNGEVVAC